MAVEGQITVWIPALLRDFAGGSESIRITAGTVRQVIEALESRFPGIKDRLCDESGLRSGLLVAVNSQLVGRQLWQPVPAGAELHFLPAIGGG